MTSSPAPAHQGTPDGACICDTAGFLSLLSCGHETWTHGETKPGGYIGCHTLGHQSSYKVMSVRGGRPAP